jgi:hypothetical protein
LSLSHAPPWSSKLLLAEKVRLIPLFQRALIQDNSFRL